MKKLYANIASIAMIVFLGLITLSSNGCDYDSPEPPPCDELKYKYASMGFFPCSVISPFLTKSNHFVLTVRDKQTGLPLEDISIKVVMHFMQMDSITCEDETDRICFVKYLFESLYGESYIAWTDANGQFSNETDVYQYDDKRQMNNITFHLTDKTGKYAPKIEYIRFPYDVSHIELTTYLLNNEML